MQFDKDTKHPFLGIQHTYSTASIPIFFISPREPTKIVIEKLVVKPIKCATLESVEKKFIKSALSLEPFYGSKMDASDPDALSFHILRASNDIARLSLRGLGRVLIVNPKQNLDEIEKKLIESRYTIVKNKNVPMKSSILLYRGDNGADTVGIYSPIVNSNNEITGHRYIEVKSHFEKYVKHIKLE